MTWGSSLDVAQVLGCSPSQVRRLVRQGRLRALRGVFQGRTELHCRSEEVLRFAHQEATERIVRAGVKLGEVVERVRRHPAGYHLSTPDVARALGCDRARVTREVRAGRLVPDPGRTYRKAHLFSQQAVLAYQEERCREEVEDARGREKQIARNLVESRLRLSHEPRRQTA